MNRWIKDEAAPPPSRYPRIDNSTLVSLESLRFPALADIRKPSEPHKAYRVFYGLDFASKGIISVDPPEANGSYPILVPQVDSDGNELAGVKMPEVAVPLATYTGWNVFNPESGPATLLSSMQGSYIPLARTRADRERANDPRHRRRALRNREQYVARVSASARELVQQAFCSRTTSPGSLNGRAIIGAWRWETPRDSTWLWFSIRMRGERWRAAPL